MILPNNNNDWVDFIVILSEIWIIFLISLRKGNMTSPTNTLSTITSDTYSNSTNLDPNCENDYHIMSLILYNLLKWLVIPFGYNLFQTLIIWNMYNCFDKLLGTNKWIRFTRWIRSIRRIYQYIG